jgi:Raf kinase inhibitor-like YbhB/YbcL family protein
MMILTSDAFRRGGKIPKKFTGEGAEVSPTLKWSGVPKNTKSFALICEDPDAPVRPGKDHPFIHWLVYNIPNSVSALPEGLDQISHLELPVFLDQGINSFGKIGYGGPMPPEGHGVHHYHFKLYALDVEAGIPEKLTLEALKKYIQPHILEEAELIGTYERGKTQADNAPLRSA